MLEAVLGQPEGVAYLGKVIAGSFTLPLLMVGPIGVGRRFAVLEAAKELFGLDHHMALEWGRHPDFHCLAAEDEKDVKVESVRSVIDATLQRPSWAPLRFVVIDGADRLTIAAANALLKVLEEPPSYLRFFLLAERLEAVMPTIRSRCALVPFRRLPESLLMQRLLKLTEDEQKALACARSSEGSLGGATRCLVSGQLVTRDEMAVVLSCASRKDLSALFSAVDKVVDLRLGVLFLGQLLHDVLLVNVAPERVRHVDATERIRQLASQIPPASVHDLLAQLRELRKRAEAAVNLPFQVKSVLASLCV